MNEVAIASVTSYFERIRTTYELGAGTPETSYYEALQGLIAAIGATLNPRVYCLSQLANTGGGSPDFGLYTAVQLQQGEPRSKQPPARGVIEMKGVSDTTLFMKTPKQLTKYFEKYRSVIVTNLRDFQIIGDSPNGQPVRLEKFSLTSDAASFWTLAKTPTSSAKKVGAAFGEFIRRALTQTIALQDPKDVAWFLASYARDARTRVEAAGNLPALTTVRTALEGALGISFEAEKGDHFFRSSLVQTLFYGLFSSWVLWARIEPRPVEKFNWKSAHFYLTVPFIQTLFQQLASPAQLKPLGLTEVLEWVGDTLNRVKPAEFLDRFDAGEAVQFFYEPFLEAFDPELRQEFGVWYTPTEIVQYMVERVDQSLKEGLGISDGLAAENVYVLDPCCGTGGFLTTVLKKISANLADHGLGDTLADRVRDAARHRVFGFEIMPAPFVVAHLQIGLALTSLNAPLGDGERAAIYLTNALTGWEPHTSDPLPFLELETERATADRIKQAEPILVILGNPPYNGFAGIATGEEERALSTEYRKVKHVAAPIGRGLNEVYTRFFRMAERRIAEKTGAGVISFISNHSWLDGLSYTGMRERFLEVFDSISIDNLHGDRKASEKAPDGRSSATIFAVRGQSPGILIGTAIVTMVRKYEHQPQTQIAYRDFHQSNADDRRAALLASISDLDSYEQYELITPSLAMRLNFKRGSVGASYADWPILTDLMPTAFPGIQTARDEFLVDIDLDNLKARMTNYFDPTLDDDDMRRLHPLIMTPSKTFDPIDVRATLRARGLLPNNFIRYTYRPFDVRWLYWEPETNLLDRKRDEYFPHVHAGHLTITVQKKSRGGWQSVQASRAMACLDLIDRGSSNFPSELLDTMTNQFRPNMSASVLAWLTERNLSHSDFVAHIVATLHSPFYAKENAGALQSDWPHIPIPADLAALEASAALGQTILALLDSDFAVPGVTSGALLSGLAGLGASKGHDYKISAGWGGSQTGRTGGTIVVPRQGHVIARKWTETELMSLTALGARHGLDLDKTLELLGGTAFDIYLNETTFWRGVPDHVWNFNIGGYPALKKWLSYREYSVLKRPLKAKEVQHFSEVVRRVIEIVATGPALDLAHSEALTSAIEWKEGRPYVPPPASKTEMVDVELTAEPSGPV